MYLDNFMRRKTSLKMDHRKNQPSKWAIVGIIVAVLLSALVFVSICVTLRVCRANNKDTINHS
jgi:hypothetical protein